MIGAAGAGPASREELVAEGQRLLQKDIDYCQTHQVRAFVYAEHASTAADFLFHVQEFEAAEKMLVGAVQVCAGSAGLMCDCAGI